MSSVEGESALEVSVGIPTMNNEDSIGRTLELLAGQTQPPDRVIIVDASDDATPDVVRSMGESLDLQVDYYRQSEGGRGVGRARKDIYERFDEDVLVCLDTDHDVREDWLETHRRFHEENPEYGVLSNSSRPGFDAPVEDPKRSEFFGQSNCSLKREALERVEGWDPWFPRGEDWDMRIRLWTAGIRSYAMNDIDAWRSERDVTNDAVTWFRKKVTASPSSVTFLRKYGSWYARFHPLHVLGDGLSIVSLLALVTLPFAAVLAPPVAVILFAVPMLLSLGYLYYKGPRKRDGYAIMPRDLTAIPVFFALGLSALNNLRRIYEDVEWNYAGFHDSGRGDHRS